MRFKTSHRIRYSLLIMLTVLLFLSGCGVQHPHKQRGINVVSSLNFYGQTAQAVLGKHGHVHSIIHSSGIDPHDFQPTDKDAERISNADFILSNGLGYDSWMKSLSTDAPRAKSIQVGPQLLHLRTGDNPHVWYATQTNPKLAYTLAARFSQKAPRYRYVFYRNANHYVNSLHSLKTITDQLHRNLKSLRLKKVDVSEPVFDYSLRRIGYRDKDNGYAEAVENGTDPSPEEIRGVQNDIKHHRIAFFVENTQASDAIVNNLVKLAHRHHVPVLSVSETMPSHKNYRQWMLSQYRQLLRIQKQEAHNETHSTR